MRIAVLPFNASEGSSEPLARQLANVFSDFLRHVEAAEEVGTINYMRTDESDGQTRYVLASPSQELNESELLQDVQRQSQADVVIDGLLSGTPTEGSLTLRWHQESMEKPDFEKTWTWTEGGIIDPVLEAVRTLAQRTGADFEQEEGSGPIFGTTSGEAFGFWLEGVDALQYIDRAQGMVAADWTPIAAMESALEAARLDPGLERAPVVVIELAKRCAQLNLAPREEVLGVLDKLQALRPEDPLTLFSLGSFYLNVGDPNRASDLLEKASRLEPNEAAIWTGLGAAQMNLGMPVNGERSLRRAIEVQKEGAFDPTPFDMLSSVLEGQGRGHEVPALWKDLAEKQPQNGLAYARQAQSLLAAGQVDQAVTLMDSALETLEDGLPVKRVYAPVLRDHEDYDRSMDFYEDVLEEMKEPDINLMLEYADVLVRANLSHEAERVLKDVLEANPDPNTRAQTQAWLIELEQPKRVAIIQSAGEKAEAGDVEGALKDLKPLRNWLADYWKLWALLASLHNRQSEWGPAEEAAKKTLEIFPGCEPAISELANSLNGQARHEEAYNLMGNALQAFPNSLPMALQFGLAAKRFGRVDEARGLAKQIREAVGPNDQLEPILREMED